MPILLLVGVCLVMVIWDAPVTLMQELLSGMNAVSYALYVLILASAVVFMPLAVMPVIPIAASLFGPLITAVLSIVGWSLGAAIAFLISRKLGRPLLEKYLSLEKLDETLAIFPENTHFWFIVVLRMTLPVDLVSYALGLTKSLSFTSYIAATIVGVSWFSFAFAYMGDAFFEGNFIVLLEITLVSLALFGIGWYILRSKKR
ncbi:MAG: putative membrane protein YdjX (TVP38/TMEM64 family) [Patiriisocius sp.]|jgi:uncharacterized membrane protein YdjX (TVP38/TMEM64 family)